MTVTPERITNDIIANSSTRAGIDLHSITLSDGTFLVAYVASDADTTAGFDIVAQQFDAIGNKIGTEMILASTVSTDVGLQFDIVALENNQIGFGFENFGDIQVEVFDVTNGVATANPALSQTVNAPGSTLLDVALSGDSLSTLKLHYAERTGTTNVLVELRDVSGGEFTASTSFASVNGNANIELDSDTLANGNTIVISDRFGGSNDVNDSFNILITAPDGTEVFSGFDRTPRANLLEPRVTALKDGGFVVGYATREVDNEVFYQVFENDGTVRAGPFRVLNTPADEDDDPEIIALDDGGFLFLLDSNTGFGGLIGRRFDSDGVGVGQTFTFDFGDTPTIIAANVMEDGRLAISNIDSGDVVTRVFTTEVPDLITGTDGNDEFSGTSGNDTLNGLDGDDKINGDGGNDTLDGGAGNDTLEGDNGDDLFIGGAGADDMDGGSDFDTVSYANSTAGLVVDFTDLAANTGDAAGDRYTDIESLIGSAFDDTLKADFGVNVIAGDGDDLIFSASNATLNGGDGDDTVSYENASGAIIQLEGVSGFHGDDELRGIENVIGSDAGDDIGGNNTANVLRGEGGQDFILGFGGDDVIRGGAANDTIEGGEGADTLAGDEGNDTIDGDEGDDVITGGFGSDVIRGGTGADNINGGGNSDVLSGGDDDDTLTGDGGADTLRGENGDDTLDGGAGEDEIEGGAGNDNIIGGDGRDAITAGAGNDLISGGAERDEIHGDAGRDTIDAGDDSDNVFGGSGNDIINGEGGSDLLLGDEGHDSISGGDGSDIIRAGSGDDVVTGDVGGDFIFGDAGDDTLDGGAGSDQVSGGIGDDLLIGGSGADILIGGDGIDTADYTASAVGVEVDLVVAGVSFSSDTITGIGQLFLNAGTGIGGDAQGDRLALIENVFGSDFDDELTGSAADNLLVGGTGEDELDGDAGNDTLLGGADDDEITGGAGNDALDGGTGIDTARFAGVEDDFSFASLSGGRVSVTAQNGEVDILSNFEFLQFDNGTFTIADVLAAAGGVPTEGDDALTGGAGADTIDGLGGDDEINGLGGADLLIGGLGDDTLRGEDGSDNLRGEDGSDVLSGGNGNDVVNGGAGEDLLFGGAGDDLMFGGAGADEFLAGSGVDRIFGGAGNDIANGGADNDIINTGADDDVVSGQAGNDLVFLQAGNDIAFGGDGNDKIFGGIGDDEIDLGDGNDEAFGGGGQDILNGAGGNDLLSGGGAGDIFVFAANQGADRITDFSTGDAIEITAFGITDGGASDQDWRDATSSVVTSGSGENVTIAWDGGGTLVLEAVGIGSLTDSDFIF